MGLPNHGHRKLKIKKKIKKLKPNVTGDVGC